MHVEPGWGADAHDERVAALPQHRSRARCQVQRQRALALAGAAVQRGLALHFDQRIAAHRVVRERHKPPQPLTSKKYLAIVQVNEKNLAAQCWKRALGDARAHCRRLAAQHQQAVSGACWTWRVTFFADPSGGAHQATQQSTAEVVSLSNELVLDPQVAACLLRSWTTSCGGSAGKAGCC